jgi:prolyl-tRNA editing enzyme YbaK/EbsC (Cys-tRNA(Pro) deacylase)
VATCAACDVADPMSLHSVRAFLAARAPDIEILEAATSTATVALAAEAHGVEPARIAKTLSLRLNDEPILLVMGGQARLDNRKYKDRFGAKAKMLDAAEVLEATSHPVGGVCPFGLPRPLRVYADVSLRRFDVVVPAAGAANSALRIAPDRLVELAGAEWVDVAQAEPRPAD